MHIILHPAFVLHHRPYRETSLLLDVFTKDHGRIALIARGVRQPRKGLRALLQPFIPLLLSWQGKTELMTLSGCEASAGFLPLKGDCLLSAFYLNELLVRLLQKQDPYPELYTIYQATLVKLAGMDHLSEAPLRIFEKKLLTALGYGLQLQCTLNKEVILPTAFYRYRLEAGFEECAPSAYEPLIFSGQSLLALDKEQFLEEDPTSLIEVKRLMRIVLRNLLGPRPLQSRKLFFEVMNESS